MGDPVLIPIERLRSHERTIKERVEELKSEISREGRLLRPILVDERTFVIIDGHHRVQALRELGCRLVPAILIDYSRKDLRVESWREGVELSKEDVLRAGLTGRPLPPKTSKHVILCGGCPLHVEFVEGIHPCPIHLLMSGPRGGGRPDPLEEPERSR